MKVKYLPTVCVIGGITAKKIKPYCRKAKHTIEKQKILQISILQNKLQLYHEPCRQYHLHNWRDNRQEQKAKENKRKEHKKLLNHRIFGSYLVNYASGNGRYKRWLNFNDKLKNSTKN